VAATIYLRAAIQKQGPTEDLRSATRLGLPMVIETDRVDWKDRTISFKYEGSRFRVPLWNVVAFEEPIRETPVAAPISVAD
jgi:hypothetical protein